RAIEVRPDRPIAYSRRLNNILLKTGRIKEGEELYRGIVERYPYNWEAYQVLYWYVAWWLGDYGAALKVIDNALARNPDRVWPHLLLANTYASGMATTSQPEKAVEAVQRALELRPNSGRVLKWAANVYEELGEPDKALDYYNQALDVNPGSGDILIRMAKLLLREGQYQRASEISYKAVQELPGIYWCYAWLGESLAYLGRSEEYLDLLQKATTQYGDDPALWVELSMGQCEAGRYDQAVSSCRRALEAKRYDTALIRFGISLWLAGDYEEALESFREAADNDYSNLWRIAILKYLGRFEEIDRFLDSLKGNPDGGESLNPFWVSWASNYKESMRRYAQALAVLEPSRGHKEEIWSQENVIEMAALYRLKGDLAEAKQILRDAGPSLPIDYDQWVERELAAIAAIEGDLKRAGEHATKACEGSSGSPFIPRSQALLARLQFASGQREEALASLTPIKRGWYIFSVFYPSLYQRGQFEELAGSSEADDYFREALTAATRAARGGTHVSRPYWGRARCYCALTSAHLGDTERARTDIEYALRLEPERADIAYYAACVYSLIGDAEEALDWLATSVERGHQELWWARVDPDLESLRELPRFQEIMNDWDRRLHAMID
ncbi:MAG: tetratricopeptide repeat protein, partial [Candidatus Latescibacterota bacterium]